MSGPFSLLAIFAHPDDESFTVGGTLARYATEGVVVSLLCATRGEAGIEGMGPGEAARVRQQELRAACAVLGVREVRFLSYRDGELAQADPAEVTARMAQAMRELRPQVVITFGPDGISGHPDHVAVSRLATAAFDAVASEGFVRRLYYVAPSPATEQGCGVPAGEVGEGVTGIDISPYREAKVRAIQCHRSQHQPFPGEPVEEAERLWSATSSSAWREARVHQGLTCSLAWTERAFRPPRFALRYGHIAAQGAGHELYHEQCQENLGGL